MYIFIIFITIRFICQKALNFILSYYHYNISRSRIDYEKVESCFNEKEVKLEPIRPNDIRRQIETAKYMSPEVDFDEAIDKSLDFLDANAPLSLSTTIPTFKISIRSLLARFSRANDLCLNIFSDVFVRLSGARLTKMTNSEVSSWVL
jgi:hypothetical protein